MDNLNCTSGPMPGHYKTLPFATPIFSAFHILSLKSGFYGKSVYTNSSKKTPIFEDLVEDCKTDCGSHMPFICFALQEPATGEMKGTI